MYALGVDGANKPIAYWQGLERFWKGTSRSRVYPPIAFRLCTKRLGSRARTKSGERSSSPNIVRNAVLLELSVKGGFADS